MPGSPEAMRRALSMSRRDLVKRYRRDGGAPPGALVVTIGQAEMEPKPEMDVDIGEAEIEEPVDVEIGEAEIERRRRRR